MRIHTIILILTYSFTYGQYPFEKYPSPIYKEYKDWKVYDWSETKQTINHTLTIDKFFNTNDSITIQLTSFTSNHDSSSVVRIFYNKKLIQKMTDKMYFSTLNTGHEPIRVADINGDGLKDIKIVTPYYGNGIAALNMNIIYLFQKEDKKFIKISFDDMMNKNRLEYDFDGDGNHEIITMDLINYEKHNYWTFNAFEYTGKDFKNVNTKCDYPIMVQFLYKDNYKITEKIDRKKMKDFTLKLPNDYEQKE